MTGGEDDSLFASLVPSRGSVSSSVNDCLIRGSTNGLLILLDPMEVVTLNGDVCITDEMLKQSSAVKKAIELAGAALHKIAIHC